ncbi:hypothetical protein KIW84_020026 [Lathyrus oleraceus]|uniref:Reverse transcriptase n=1 Tax=Pisum sativum TaxID=3888 RepID=A0A9D4Y4L4_PEA|nr:hypothetical protein KIW84_020026 [Pisum sativum]
MLKGSIKIWSKEVFGWYDVKAEENIDVINDIDNQLCLREGNEVKDLVDNRNTTYKSLWRHLYIKDNMLFQKSRVKWNRKGHLNSKYYHDLIKGWARRNFIVSNITEGVMVDLVEEVNEAIRSFFKAKFDELDNSRPMLEGIPFKFLFEDPVRIWKDMDTIRQCFLWGGTEVKNNIHWVRWNDVCKEKDLVGLAIKSIKDFNLALLSKWQWKILEESNALWKRVLKARYGGIEHFVLKENIFKANRSTSF